VHLLLQKEPCWIAFELHILVVHTKIRFVPDLFEKALHLTPLTVGMNWQEEMVGATMIAQDFFDGGIVRTSIHLASISVATPLWPSVGVKPNTWKSWGFGVLRDSRMFRAQQKGAKHLALGCSWCYWKGLET
jgi:hypothetical protein